MTDKEVGAADKAATRRVKVPPYQLPVSDTNKRRKDFEISRIDRFRHRTCYFTDSGIIGSKEFAEKLGVVS